MRTILTTALIFAALATGIATPAVAAADNPPRSAPASRTVPSLRAAPASLATPARPLTGTFDLQSHRGGRGEWTEESLVAFSRSLELGVSTLEMDTHLTADDKVVVWHDDVMTGSKCRDTGPAFEDDPAFPYSGDRVRDLRLAQIQTMDCGYQQLPGYPEQDNIEGNRIAELSDVFDVVRDHDAGTVLFNIETKVESAGPTGTTEMKALTRGVVTEIQDSGMAERVTLQSFDWASLNLTGHIAPELALAALSGGDAWMGVGQPGASPNLGGIDIDDYDGSLAQAARAQGYDALSPVFDSVTPEMIAEAHDLGLPVVPWTVSDESDIRTLLDMGVDGIITDYPSRLREILAERGQTLPRPYTL